MTNKVLDCLFIVLIILLWNQFAVKFLVQRFIATYKRVNHQRVNKPISKFLIENELQIINAIRAFYWLGCIYFILNQFL